MRLHRLVLSNFRGIAHREIDFPDHGVTVVSGPNEVGKSSMIEALDLLLESKDRSSKKNIKEVKPTHADVGSEVTAEISTGPYRFVYRKRFHKKCETELSILAPQREQLTGDEAHDRVRAMLESTVDTGLWQALRVLQSASTSAVDLSGCDALSRALDVAAGDAANTDQPVGLSSTEPLLIEKIENEYSLYYTSTGRETGQLAQVISALLAAEGDLAQRVQDVIEVEQKVARHAELTDELAALVEDRAVAGARLAAAEVTAATGKALTDQLHTARTQRAAAVATHTAAAAAHRERLRLRADARDRASALAEARTAATQAAEAAEAGQDAVAEAERAAADADLRSGQAQGRVEAAEREIALLDRVRQAQQLVARLDRIDTAQRERDDVTAKLGVITMTDAGFSEIEAGAAAVDTLRIRADLVSPTVTVTAERDIEVVVGDRAITLSAGQTCEVTATEQTVVRIPGLFSATVQPGVSAAETHTTLAAAQQDLDDALRRAGVGDLGTARRVEGERRGLAAQRDQLSERLTGLLGDDDPDQLRAQLSALSAMATSGGTDDADALQAELVAASSARDQVDTDRVACRQMLSTVTAEQAERSTTATVLRDKADTAQIELANAEDRLCTQRSEITDDDLAIASQQSCDRVTEAEAAVTELSARLAETGADTANADLADARDVEAGLAHRSDEVAQALRDLTVQLELIGTQGRAGELDASRIRHEHAKAECARVTARANAARLLRSVMARHRDDTRRRYVQPFRAAVQRLGRTVFGATFEVEVDSDLKIISRTLDGCTVPFHSLSGGAKEQLGIVARLAVATLVDSEDVVPVMIDDALGFTDADRLARMGAVFDAVGTNGQVIVLTCDADRYRGVSEAHAIELSA